MLSIDLARRYKVRTESYIDNTFNFGFHNNYEFYDVLESVEPHEDDVIFYDGKEVVRGRFLGHPSDDQSLYMVKTKEGFSLYQSDKLLLEGDNLSIYGDLCIQQCGDKCRIVNLNDNSEVTTIENSSFIGYDAEHKLFAFGNKVYSLFDDKLAEYHGEVKMFKFDLPIYDIKAEASIKGGEVCQNNQYTSLVKHDYGVGTISSDNCLLVIAHTAEDKIKDKRDVIKTYFDKVVHYTGTSEQKEEINSIKQAYSILYNEDISAQKDEEGLTPFERLCHYNFESNFLALRDFYLDDFKKEKDTKMPIMFFSEFFNDRFLSAGKLTDDDIKLMADFMARNPNVWGPISSDVFLKFAKVSPEMVVNFVKYSSKAISTLKELGQPVRSLVNDILQKEGIQFYNVEDFLLAPNKEFWESIKENGFGEPQRALRKLCVELKSSADKESFRFITAKKLLTRLLNEHKDIVADGVKNSWLSDDFVKLLVKEGFVQDEQIVKRINDLDNKEMPKIAALDAISYGKKSISLKCRLEDIANFSDFGDVAPRYHMSCGSQTTFLNEMLIYGMSEEAAYALSHGASPFQKIEFFNGKRTGMPFAGVFLRAQKNNFDGVQYLMDGIARNLDIERGQEIITEIEKSLGQNLRSNPAVAGIMKNMRETFMQTKLKAAQRKQKEEEHKIELEQSYRFKKEHQQELDDLDKAYRLACRKEIDEYPSIFDGSTEFCFDRYSHKYLYNQENIDKVREIIVQKEAHNQLVDKIKEQIFIKDESTDKSIKDRFSEFGYSIYLTDEEVVFKKGTDGYTRQTIPFAENTILRLEDFVKQWEEKRRIEQEQYAEKQRLLRAQEEERQFKEDCKARGLPSNIEIWHRVGGSTNCGEGWVIKPDGSLREPTGFEAKKYMSHDGYKTWEQIFPGEVVLSWAKGSTAAEHEFEVIYMPKEGLTVAQKEKILSIEEDIQEEWKDRRGFSSGVLSPDVGMGWNICGRKVPLQNKEYTAESNTNDDVEDFVDDTPDRQIEEADLVRLLEAFGQSR